MDIPRINAKDVHRRMSDGSTLLLVCAYDTEDRFREMELEGAISWPALTAMLPSIPKDQEIVFYCG